MKNIIYYFYLYLEYEAPYYIGIGRGVEALVEQPLEYKCTQLSFYLGEDLKDRAKF